MLTKLHFQGIINYKRLNIIVQGWEVAENSHLSAVDIKLIDYKVNSDQ